jgi:hypothetical protein
MLSRVPRKENQGDENRGEKAGVSQRRQGRPGVAGIQHIFGEVAGGAGGKDHIHEMPGYSLLCTCTQTTCLLGPLSEAQTLDRVIQGAESLYSFRLMFCEYVVL